MSVLIPIPGLRPPALAGPGGPAGRLLDVALPSTLLRTAPYPVVAYLAFVLTGLAVGRLDPGSRRVAVPRLNLGVVCSLVFAVCWGRWRRRGPLEELVARASDGVRRAVLRRSGTVPTRGGR